MRNRPIRTIATLACGMLALAWMVTDVPGASRDRALRDLVGSVESVRRTSDDQGSAWLEITLHTQDGETLDARVAPLAVIGANAFRIDVGDTVRLRVFADERPAGVSRIRNLDTGQTLRLRCLSGDPIWSLREPAMRGPAERGGRRAGRGPS